MPSITYTAGTGWQKFNVPKGVDRVTVDVKGAGSGAARGGRVQGQIRVKADDVLYLLVGAAGDAPSGMSGGVAVAGGGGAGGDAGPGRTGGRGGGGASAIRMNSATGTIKAVAGGAGGKSGDDGQGGDGGGSTGEHGFTGTAGSGTVGNATGGTQIQGGKGGTSSAAAGLSGNNAVNSALARGGRGGQLTSADTHGGGGGGGGYRAGGGGVAALIGATPGGGGGGGSSYTGGLFTGVSATQGGGPTGDGSIVVSWVGPPPANQPPSAPSDVKINGKPESSGMGTKSTGRVTVSAILRDPTSTTVAPTHTGGPSTQKHQDARMLLRYSSSRSFTRTSEIRSDLVGYGDRAEVVLTGLAVNTHYYGRIHAVDKQGAVSQTYNSIDFWTNRNPDAPTLQAPSDNGILLSTDATTFDWAHHDPDPDDGQSAFEIRWRRTRDGSTQNSPWTTVRQVTSFDNYVTNPGRFKGGDYYEWTVRTRDQQNAWGDWAIPRSFYAQDVTSPPRLTSPSRDEAVDATDDTTLKWVFRDPNTGAVQEKADYRFRVVGTSDWVTVLGDTTTPGVANAWTVPPMTFQPQFHYEWQMRSYRLGGTGPSDWSDSATFWTHAGIGSLSAPVVIDNGSPFEKLGCGTHRVFIYDRGGKVLRGEITPIQKIQWTRQRDDIGGATITTNGFGSDCGQLLSQVHTWMNELVIYRDGVRVMEGPITLIEDAVDGFTIECKDVMGYVYRRIMKQGYNDSYHLTAGIAEGLLSVVERSRLIIANALVRDDPNVLPYLTSFDFPDDARQSRSVPDFAKTAWEEVDDMAQNAGLDYSVIGRRIILNDTHRPVGRLPEFRPDYFSAPPKITEYGMLLCDLYGVTNNAGLYGVATKPNSPYQGVEILVSSFGEDAAGAVEVLTQAQQQAVVKVLTEQANRGIASRYPAPYIVRVPDNSQLMPDVPVGINQLVPGVWIPLRAQGTVIELAQWQKLDQVQVTESEGDEQVRVTLSAAPNGGQDPDATGDDTGDATT